MNLRRGDEGDLSEHERQLLHHIPATAPGVPLGDVARHLALPNGLPRRGAPRGAPDSVLDPERRAGALARLGAAERRALVGALERIADAGAALPAASPRRRRRRRPTRSL